MKFYVISFDTKLFKMNAEVIKIEWAIHDIYYELSSILGSDSLEFVDFNDEVVMVIDEDGKFKKNNPIFRVITDDGITLDLAGKILFARNVENEFSTDIGSIMAEDIFYLRNNLNIQLLGVVKGE
ncbi:hypothetical protein GCM10007425_17970 [Lysinibacillus alkalisoli]|uniref:DUF3846 domain-containing protein n=1 Tax=Lysinibacillus alkalisoli TaxID=1911548 RepID=A0A917LH10_9BACI|nr:hypothetical protein [Lysinibacillus alkalisoli]GGG23928.1 hypothetical protein GCM10007425_17970 [Lysinibacillus alkalisoli]